MIGFRTGRPGEGKTLSAVESIVAYVKEGRRVYALNVNGLDYEKTGALPWEWPLSEWQERLKPGDVLVVDEVQDYLPKNMTSRTTPPLWVSALTKNRHGGIDMLWITQNPKNVDAFARNLINEHKHYVRNNGKEEAYVYRWPVGVEEPESPGEKKRAERTKWKYPTQLYPLYKSAELHTHKVHTPRPVKILRWSLAAAVVCIAIAFFAVSGFKKGAASSEAAPSKGQKIAGKQNALLSPGGARRAELTPAEWAAQFHPRIEGVIWSAPAFDRRGAESQPEVWCIASETRCSCLSEQGTDVDMPQKQCRAFAIHGFYNPMREARRVERQDMQRTQSGEQVAMVDAGKWSDIAPDSPPVTQQGQGAQAHKWRGLHDAYNPDVFGPRSTQTP